MFDIWEYKRKTINTQSTDTKEKRGETLQTEGVGVMCPTGSNTEQYKGSARSLNPFKLGKTTEAHCVAVTEKPPKKSCW